MAECFGDAADVGAGVGVVEETVGDVVDGADGFAARAGEGWFDLDLLDDDDVDGGEA